MNNGTPLDEGEGRGGHSLVTTTLTMEFMHGAIDARRHKLPVGNSDRGNGPARKSTPCSGGIRPSTAFSIERPPPRQARQALEKAVDARRLTGVNVTVTGTVRHHRRIRRLANGITPRGTYGVVSAMFEGRHDGMATR